MTPFYRKHLMFEQPADVIVLVTLSCLDDVFRTDDEVQVIFNETLWNGAAHIT